MFEVLERLKRSKAVMFFDFYRGNAHWRKTSADVDITYLGNEYKSTPGIDMTDPVQSADLAQAYVNIELPATDDFVRANCGFPSGRPVRVTVYAEHRDAADTIQILDYRMVNWRFKKAICEIRFESDMTRNKNVSLNRTASAQCPFVLYDQTPNRCNVQRENFRTDTSVSILGPLQLSCPAASSKPDGYFLGGEFNWVSPLGVTEARAIDGHTGSVITIRAAIPGLASGATAALYPGCNHAPGTTGDCHAKFDNFLNYGGQWHLPEKDPYDGTPNVYGE